MKIEWLLTDVTVVGSPDRAERAILGVILAWRFLANSGRICGRGAALWCRNPLLSSNNFTQGHLIEMEWFATNVTAVGSPDRAERAILGVILSGRFFGQLRTYLWLLSLFTMQEPPLEP